MRCLLWMLSQILALESKVLRGCARALESFSGLENGLPSPPPAVVAVVSPLTLFGTACEWIRRAIPSEPAPSDPPPILGVFYLIQDSWDLCLAYLARWMEWTPSKLYLRLPALASLLKGNFATRSSARRVARLLSAIRRIHYEIRRRRANGK